MFTKKLWYLILDFLFFALLSFIIVFVVFGTSSIKKSKHKSKTQSTMRAATTLSLPLTFKENQ